MFNLKILIESAHKSVTDTHFLLADNGTENTIGSDIEFRTRLEASLTETCNSMKLRDFSA